MIYTKTGSGAGPIDGFIALGRIVARRINIYRRRRNILLPALIATQPTDSSSQADAVDWSGDSSLVVASGDFAAGVKFFTRSGETFTARSVPSNITISGGDCSISSDGAYLAACSDADGRIWHNNAGTLTRLTSVGSFTTGSKACAVSSDGKYAAFLGGQSPTFLRIKEKSGTGNSASYADMTLASQPASGAGGGTNLAGLAFSPDDTYLAVCPSNQNNQTIYKLNTGTGIYEQLASPFSGALPDDSVRGCAFSAQGDFLAIATGNKTFFYERTADTFTNVATAAIFIPSTGLFSSDAGRRGGFHPSGNFYITGRGQIFRKNSASSWSAVGSALQSSGACAAFSPYII